MFISQDIIYCVSLKSGHLSKKNIFNKCFNILFNWNINNIFNVISTINDVKLDGFYKIHVNPKELLAGWLEISFLRQMLS